MLLSLLHLILLNFFGLLQLFQNKMELSLSIMSHAFQMKKFSTEILTVPV